ncbi:MAG: chemotaxis protein CheC [Gemmatimonadales bacterium]
MVDAQKLTEVERDALREIANIGAGHAATALSQMTGRKIMINVPEVTVKRLEEAAELLGEADTVVAAVLMHMMGDLTGRTLLVLPETSARGLCNILLRKTEPGPGFTEMQRSTVMETGNILCSAYLNALSDFMGMMLVPSVPALVVDLAGAVLTTAYLNFGHARDYVICVETAFRIAGSDEVVNGQFILMPDVASLQAIFDAIHLAK